MEAPACQLTLSGHAWVATAAALYQLPELGSADDAIDAVWFPFTGIGALDAAVESCGCLTLRPTATDR